MQIHILSNLTLDMNSIIPPKRTLEYEGDIHTYINIYINVNFEIAYISL